MIRSTRAYRLVAALLGLSLLLSIGLPVVQHVCAMTMNGAAEQVHDCHETAPVEHGEHCDMMADGQATLGNTCCLVDVQQSQKSDARLDRAAEPLAEDVLLPMTERPVPAPDDTEGPPAPHDAPRTSSSLSLHVLHETFLN